MFSLDEGRVLSTVWNLIKERVMGCTIRQIYLSLDKEGNDVDDKDKDTSYYNHIYGEEGPDIAFRELRRT